MAAGRQLPQGSVRPSGRCWFAVARAPFVSLVGSWKTASFLEGSESNVRQWRLLPAGQALGAVARRPGPSLMALLFRCGEGAVCEPCWRLETATASFLVGSESNVRHWGLLPAGPVRPSGPCCFAVARAPFVNLVGGWKPASCLV